MKKLVFLFLCCSSLSFAQDTKQQNQTAVAEKTEKMAENKTKGEFYFTLPAGLTAEQVKKNASFYTNRFTVNFDEKTHLAQIKMITNDERSRHIISRFLIASGVSDVKMGQTTYKVDEFYEKYLK